MKELFLHIWHTRPHYSEISGKPLSEHDPRFIWFFAHILSKGAEPALRLDPRNICLMTPDEHVYYDQQTHKAKQDPRYQWVFEYGMFLRRQLYEQRRIIK